MSTLARLLLVCASLFLGPLVVMADELPEYTNKITSLTPEQAKRLVAEVKVDGLSLNGLTTLDATTAKALAEFKGHYLSLGLTTLEAATAKALAGFKGERLDLNRLTTLDAVTAEAITDYKGSELNGCELHFDGLTTLDTDTAKALAAFIGSELHGSELSLNGLTTLSAAVAKAIAEYRGSELHLDGLATLDPAAATALAEYKGEWLHLNSLATLDPRTAKALAEFAGELSLQAHVVKTFIEKHPFGKETALSHAKLRRGNLCELTTLDGETAKALAAYKGALLQLDGLRTLDAATAESLAGFAGNSLSLKGLHTASFVAVAALRNNPRIHMPNHWYLLRYEIAALVGTVVFVVMAGIVVWYSRRQRTAG
jgi:hypothetical protein